MDRHISDDQLDRALVRLLAERGDAIVASGISPAATAARIRTCRTALVPRSMAWLAFWHSWRRR
jgi:hypothetical protein